MLATRLILDQGIEVIGVGFSSPFFDSGRGRRAAGILGVGFRSRDLTAGMIAVLKAPRYGYGKNCNPCTDCHRLMVASAASLLAELGASFIVSGEVLGQRPKSQTRDALNAVAKGAGRGLLLRPLCALLLEETAPEREGWVDRSRLLGISGRSRKVQLELAERYGLSGYQSPGGGCLLTEAGYCRKLKELKEHEGWKKEELSLLRVGRHFRLSSGARAVSGRDQEENEGLERLARPGDLLFQAAGRPGSLILLRKKEPVTPRDRELAAAICRRYSKERKSAGLAVNCRVKGEAGETVIAAGVEDTTGLMI
jgi:tRNA-uridine 2-sulfurtransferase